MRRKKKILACHSMNFIVLKQIARVRCPWINSTWLDNLIFFSLKKLFINFIIEVIINHIIKFIVVAKKRANLSLLILIHREIPLSNVLTSDPYIGFQSLFLWIKIAILPCIVLTYNSIDIALLYKRSLTACTCGYSKNDK